MRAMMKHVFVPVAIDPETGDVLRDSKSGFAVPTNKKFLRDVFTNGDLYYRTGDALRRCSDGASSIDSAIPTAGGAKTSTAEVSEVIGQFPGVSEANVYGVRLPNHEGRAGCAAVRIDLNTCRNAFDYMALARFARSKLPRYAVPLFLRIVETPTYPQLQAEQNASSQRGG
ncbi:hypothetical protein BJX63DRAFT_435478 [Aspergillus granulosus]|uniref:AMP-binding enzyme C-terminal domain-containing protein n=1 Tax=Aspergillus granulosus TaxID=176169 RepID=A0ABR4H147_9EURO